MSNTTVEHTNGSQLPAVTENGYAFRPAHAVAVGTKGGVKFVQYFNGQDCSLSQLREQGRAKGMKGNALTAWVHEQFFASKPAREQLGVAWVQAAIQDGYVPDAGTRAKNSATLRLVKPKSPKASAAEVTLASVLEQAKALKSDELKGLLEQLTAK